MGLGIDYLNYATSDWNEVLHTLRCYDYARLVYKLLRNVTSCVTMCVVFLKG